MFSKSLQSIILLLAITDVAMSVGTGGPCFSHGDCDDGLACLKKRSNGGTISIKGTCANVA